jgi:hypothetical protein
VTSKETTLYIIITGTVGNLAAKYVINKNPYQILPMLAAINTHVGPYVGVHSRSLSGSSIRTQILEFQRNDALIIHFDTNDVIGVI